MQEIQWKLIKPRELRYLLSLCLIFGGCGYFGLPMPYAWAGVLFFGIKKRCELCGVVFDLGIPSIFLVISSAVVSIKLGEYLWDVSFLKFMVTGEGIASIKAYFLQLIN